MKRIIVADESVDFRVVKQLRKDDFEVYAICEMQPSINDKMVLDIATEKDAILVAQAISEHYSELQGKFSVLSEKKLRIKEQ